MRRSSNLPVPRNHNAQRKKEKKKSVPKQLENCQLIAHRCYPVSKNVPAIFPSKSSYPPF